MSDELKGKPAGEPVPVTVAAISPTTAPMPVTSTDPMVKLALIALLGTFLTGLLTLGTNYLNYLAQQNAAVRVEEVKDTLATAKTDTDEKLDSIQEVADATHTLTNSAMGTSLELVVSAYTQLLASDPSNKSVQAQLATAKKTLATHVANQKIVDAGLQKQIE